MAGRLIAQLVIAGGTVLMRASVQAWQQALVNAQRSGVASETLKAATGKAESMSLSEAQLILGLGKDAAWHQVMKRYKHMFEVNEKQGSFYLQSKVFRAHERIAEAYEEEGKKGPDEPPEPIEK